MTEPVRVSVVDSGANAPHPHLPAVSGGVAIDLEGHESDDWTDRLGHGTAAAAAIHEKAPAAEIYAVKVFDRELATTVSTLVRAIDWASSRDHRLINLSLGTPNDFREAELVPPIERAVERDTLVVSAYEHEGRRWYPGSMRGAIGVVLDPEQDRDTVTVVELYGSAVLRAAPWPRPIPGVPRERNMNGISFAVANATGVLASLLATRPDVRSADAAIDLVRSV